MAEALPLFPLNTVLFPGIPLPLHIFEDRYRLLMTELLEQPGPHRFGVVAIRIGLEVGDDPEVYDIGCVAEIRHVEPWSDGRMNIVTVGGPRFVLRDVDDSRPYLRGAVDYLPEPAGGDANAVAAKVAAAFPAYWSAAADARAADDPSNGLPRVPELPDDPALLSWLVAAALQVDLPDKQMLLALPDTTTRLRRELTTLRRETALIRRWLDDSPTVPTEGPFSLN